jgi:hypothetical protein
MQLPQDLQSHFGTPSLLVVADHVLAKLYLIAGDAVEEIDGIAVPRERMTDHEGGVVNIDSGAVASPENHVEDARLHQFATLVADAIEDALASGSAERYLLAMDAELAHLVTAKLSSETQGKRFREVHANLLKESPLDILRRCLAA